MIPTLNTERLVLRGYVRDDFPAFAEIWGDDRVVAPLGIPPMSEEDAWGRFCRYVGHWALLGHGTWAVCEKASGALVGEVGLFDFKRGLGPEYDSDPEHGWAFAAAAQGKGYATEAVAATMAWGATHFTPFNPFCIISPANAPSLRVAEKAGYREAAQTMFKGKLAILLRRGA